MAQKNLRSVCMANVQTRFQIANPKKPSTYLDTLEHHDHEATSKGFSPPQKNLKTLQKRAKNAFFSKSLAFHLSNLETPLRKAYRTTLFDCCSTLMQEGKVLTANMYCGYRWCNVCNRIRTGKLMNGYLKPLEALNKPYFVTTTIPNVLKADLRMAMKNMIKVSSNIVRALNRLKTPMNGIRKVECTYNANTDTYHPHLHLIFDGKEAAEKFVSEWLVRYPDANATAQNYKPISNTNGIKELFKYVTKIVTKTEIGFNIYVPALDTIFSAMKGMRTFQSFGSIRKVNDDIYNLEAEEYQNIEPYEFVMWLWNGNDWENMVNGNMLTNYKPSKRMTELVTEKMIV